LSAASPGDTLSGHLGRTWEAAMSQAALVNGVILCFVVLLALLLVLFLYAVAVARPEDAVPAEASALESLAPTPAARPSPPPAPLPVRRPQALVPPAGRLGQSGGAGYAARHTSVAVPVISPPKASSSPPRRPGAALMLVIAGLAIAVIGGWLLVRTGQAATACSHQAAAICSQGFVTGMKMSGVAGPLAACLWRGRAGWHTVRPSGTGAPGVKQGGQAGVARWAESPC
jgi:hypothetical protein